MATIISREHQDPEFPSRESRDAFSRRGVALSRERVIIYEVSERAIQLDGYRA